MLKDPRKEHNYQSQWSLKQKRGRGWPTFKNIYQLSVTMIIDICN